MTSSLLSLVPESPDDDLSRLADAAGRFLAIGPEPAHVCRYLVLHMPWREGARGALLALCQEDGHIEIAGSFGYPKPLVAAYRRLSLFDHTPLTDAITKDSTLCIVDAASMAEHYPALVAGLGGFVDSSGATGLIAVPLVSDAGPVGVLGMTFAESVPKDSLTCSQIAALKPLLTIHLSLMARALDDEVSTPAAIDAGDVVMSPSLGLTTRQMRVLQMLAKKMTNQRIAVALDYSLSTVRMDTMAIYRALGADGRRDAVSKARAMGLITPPAFHSER